MKTKARRGKGADWGGRALLVLLLIVLGWFSVTRSLAAALGGQAADAAIALAPQDAGALGQAADNQMMQLLSAQHRATAVAFATRAFERDPTSLSAIVTFALDAEARHDYGREDRLFRYAEKLSRRDLRTELYLIEKSVRDGDVAGALNHYDIALRTDEHAPEIMFPVLRSALADAALRSAMVRMLQRRPPWRDAFLGYAAGTGPDFDGAMQLLIDLRRAERGTPDAVTVSATSAALSGLVGASQTDRAWAAYVVLHPGTDPIEPANANFNPVSGLTSPFDWQLSSDTNVQASIDRERGRGLLTFSLPATATGMVARQLRVLPAGSYRLDTVAVRIAQPEGSRPYWQLICADGRPLGTVEIGNADANGAKFGGTVTVPGDCKSQWLQLIARPTDAVEGITGAIDSVSLHRIG